MSELPAAAKPTRLDVTKENGTTGSSNQSARAPRKSKSVSNVDAYPFPFVKPSTQPKMSQNEIRDTIARIQARQEKR